LLTAKVKGDPVVEKENVPRTTQSRAMTEKAVEVGPYHGQSMKAAVTGGAGNNKRKAEDQGARGGERR
jgi:hypothetical protein